MDLLKIKKAHIPNKPRKRVGRGGGSGQGITAGRGQKGQNSRQGVGRMPIFEGGTMPLYRRLPKRGFNNKRFQRYWISVNLEKMNSFKEGDEINLETLKNAGIIKVPKSKKCHLKLLGRGELQVKNLKIKVHKISESAKQQVEKANGTIEIIKIPKFKRPPRRKIS